MLRHIEFMSDDHRSWMNRSQSTALFIKMPRNSISEAHATGEDYVEVVRLLNVKRTLAWFIIYRFQQYGQVLRQRGGPGDCGNAQWVHLVTNQCGTKPRVCDSTVSKTPFWKLAAVRNSGFNIFTIENSWSVWSWPPGCPRRGCKERTELYRIATLSNQNGVVHT